MKGLENVVKDTDIMKTPHKAVDLSAGLTLLRITLL